MRDTVWCLSVSLPTRGMTVVAMTMLMKLVGYSLIYSFHDDGEETRLMLTGSDADMEMPGDDSDAENHADVHCAFWSRSREEPKNRQTGLLLYRRGWEKGCCFG